MSHAVIVLGAGIVGICSALSLAERGARVRIIDRGAPGQEASFGNAGVISPWSFIPQSLPGLWRSIPKLMFGPHRAVSIRRGSLAAMMPWGVQFLRNGTEAKVRAIADQMEVLCGPSVDLYRKHLSGTGHESLLAESLYVHAFRDGSRASLHAIDYRIRMEKGADLALIGSTELRRLEPALSPEFQAAVLIKGQARAISPGKIAQVLADKAKAAGVEFIRDDIQGVAQDANAWVVRCRNDAFRADKVVVALGAWSMEVLKALGQKMPLMAERGYHVEFPNPGVAVNNSIMDVDAKVVASSMEEGLRLAGQAEFAPIDAPVDPHKEAQMLHIARQTLPSLEQETPARHWMGRRPSFPDSLPALGEVAGKIGLYCNFGHSHYGLMMAPKSGELIADIVTGSAPNVDISALSPGRFG